MTRRPPASISRVPAPRHRSISRAPPTSTMRSPMIAIASAAGRAGSPVQTFAWVITTSAAAGLVRAHDEPAAVSATAATGPRIDVFHMWRELYSSDGSHQSFGRCAHDTAHERDHHRDGRRVVQSREGVARHHAEAPETRLPSDPGEPARDGSARRTRVSIAYR